MRKVSSEKGILGQLDGVVTRGIILWVRGCSFKSLSSSICPAEETQQVRRALQLWVQKSVTLPLFQWHVTYYMYQASKALLLAGNYTELPLCSQRESWDGCRNTDLYSGEVSPFLWCFQYKLQRTGKRHWWKFLSGKKDEKSGVYLTLENRHFWVCHPK